MGKKNIIYVYSKDNKEFEGYCTSKLTAMENAIYEYDLVKDDKFYIAERVEIDLVELLPCFSEIKDAIEKQAQLKYKKLDVDNIQYPSELSQNKIMQGIANALLGHRFDLGYFKTKNKMECVVTGSGTGRFKRISDDTSIDAEERLILQEALGEAHKRGVVARKKYINTIINSDKFDTCMNLVNKKLMKVKTKGKSTIFIVTQLGAEKVGMSRRKYNEIPR